MKKLRQLFLSLTGKERRVFLLSFSALVLGVLIFAFLIFSQITEPVPARGGVFTEGILGQPSFINPILASSEVDKNLSRLLFSRLGEMATTIESSEDGRVWKLRIAEGLLWSDGEKLTSDDIIFTIQKIHDRDAKSPLFSSWQGVSAERLSELELQLRLAAPFSFFRNTLESLSIIPKHIFEKVPATNWRISDYNLKPVGSGPYRFADFNLRSDGFITTYSLEANPKYFKTKPLIEEFNINFYTEVDELIGAFNRGYIDGIANLPFGALSLIKRTHQETSFNLAGYYAAFINQSRNIALEEKVVRRALDLAAPKKLLVEEVFEGKARIEDGPIPSSGIRFNQNIVGEENLELAKEILEDAGWKIGDDPTFGFRSKTIKGSMVPLSITITTPDIEFLKETALILKDAWEKAGIKVEVSAIPPEEVVENRIKNRDYEVLVFGNVLNLNSDLFPFWHSSERFYPGLNLSLYNNKEVDRLIEEVRRASDEVTVAEAFNKLQEIISEDYPAVFLYSPDYVYVSNKNLRGVAAYYVSEPADRLNQVTGWHLKTTRVLK